MRWLRGALGDLRLRLLGPGEIQPGARIDPDTNTLVVDETPVQALISCLHRWPDGSPSWGPCRRIGVGPDQWAWYATCQQCGRVARC